MQAGKCNLVFKLLYFFFKVFKKKKKNAIRLNVHLLMVSPEMIVSGKALPALSAFEHSLSQVKHLVSFETLRSAEAFAAFGAAVRSHPRVLSLVSL